MQRSTTSFVRGLAIAGVCGFAASVASGQVSHYVPFDEGYLAGVDLNAQGGFDLGFGFNVWWDGSPVFEGATVIGGNLPAPAGLPVAGNCVSTHPVNFDLAYYTFDQDADFANGEPEDRLQPGVHWLSFIVRSDTNAYFGGLSLVKFFGDEVLYIGKIGGEGGTEWGVDPGGNQVAAGGDINLDTFLVAKLTIGPDANDDTVELFIDPPLGTAAPATPDLTQAFNEDPNNNRGIDEIRIGGQNGPFTIDEIRIGPDFESVACCAVCPADLNGDGILDNGDIATFIPLFLAQDLVVDFNADGIIDNGDIAEFVALFLAGC